MSKIIDCFTFYNEMDLLTYRLHVLNDVVDYFIIVESTHTHVGKEKKLFFNENKHLFETFSEKIIHIIVDDFPHKIPNIDDNDKVWKNEHFQRNAISRGIDCIHDIENSDLIIISDLDEIPDPRTLDKIKKDEIHVEMNSLQMDFYYYNLNTRNKNKWTKSKIISYRNYKESNLSCNEIRFIDYPELINGGWHLSYFGDKYFIQNKIQQFAHQEYNNKNYTDLNIIQERIENVTDLYGRDNELFEKIKIEDNTYLPLDYNKYLNTFYHS